MFLPKISTAQQRQKLCSLAQLNMPSVFLCWDLGEKPLAFLFSVMKVSWSSNCIKTMYLPGKYSCHSLSKSITSNLEIYLWIIYYYYNYQHYVYYCYYHSPQSQQTTLWWATYCVYIFREKTHGPHLKTGPTLRWAETTALAFSAKETHHTGESPFSSGYDFHSWMR